MGLAASAGTARAAPRAGADETMPKPNPHQTMADVLRRAVRDSGRSVNAVAVAAGVPQPVLYRFVTGQRDLTLDTAQKLADYFGLELRPRK